MVYIFLTSSLYTLPLSFLKSVGISFTLTVFNSSIFNLSTFHFKLTRSASLANSYISAPVAFSMTDFVV